MRELHAGGGSCNVQTRIGTGQCLIICMLLPNNFQIPYVYFQLLFTYFHGTNVILQLLPLQSKSNIASGPAGTVKSSILSDLPVSLFLALCLPASCFCFTSFIDFKYFHLWLAYCCHGCTM